jgi:hypothetical protein
VDAATAQGNPIGTAIHRIEFDWPVPEIRQTQSQEYKRYSSSAFEGFFGPREDDGESAPEFHFRPWDEPVACAQCEQPTMETAFIKGTGQVCPTCFKTWKKSYMGAHWRGTDD